MHLIERLGKDKSNGSGNDKRRKQQRDKINVLQVPPHAPFALAGENAMP
jgi:hypothetical protein